MANKLFYDFLGIPDTANNFLDLKIQPGCSA